MFLKRESQLHTIIELRAAAIVIQVLLILFVYFSPHYQLHFLPLFTIIAFETLFTLCSYLAYRKEKAAGQYAVFAQIFSDILFLSLLLYFSGGATNAFVSLLLIPIAIAAVTLTPVMLVITTLSAILSYSVLLWLLPMNMMHGNMEGHFIAMWINFLFSSIVVAFVVGNMARAINKRELAIAAFREEQLKQEKIISLGVASAQVTHQLATPIATVQLLADELSEDYPEDKALGEMQQQLTRCQQNLQAFRQLALDLKEQTTQQMACQDIIAEIQQHIGINYPDIHSVLVSDEESNEKSDEELDETTDDESANTQPPAVIADVTLLPAILNLVNNGVRATKANNSNAIELQSLYKKGLWQFSIRDFGAGFTLSKLAELGVEPVSSEQGLGMAVFLSHASLERLGAKLELTNHIDGGALVTLSLPLAKSAA
ncbi:HAMP domain-containing histidine kinase [Thalassomonas viridans]|uniref:histidine kinase n=1 Tax=Thalassomonas viridans TaxID=137584 RepID=A0AAF0CAE0_9GAMM|nr:HAMP domain-containing sensor histidine kinase [Thalassomonas viridans]WDE06210.1 HAMP domain-containing histidine kinase [Thalassomonas viridans]